MNRRRIAAGILVFTGCLLATCSAFAQAPAEPTLLQVMHGMRIADGKAFFQVGEVVHVADPEAATVRRIEVPDAPPGLFAASPWIGLWTATTTRKRFVRIDARTSTVMVTPLENPDRYGRCGFLDGIGPSAWICSSTAKRLPEFDVALIDAASGKQYQLPTLALNLFAGRVRGRWDGKTLWVFWHDSTATGGWRATSWRLGESAWKVRAAGPALALLASGPKRAKQFDRQVREIYLSSYDRRGPDYQPQWVGNFLFVAAAWELRGLDTATGKRLIWSIPDHLRTRQMWPVGKTVAFGEYVYHSKSRELRKLPLPPDTVWVGSHAIVPSSKCPADERCRSLAADGPFRDLAIYTPDLQNLPRADAIKGVHPPPPRKKTAKEKLVPECIPSRCCPCINGRPRCKPCLPDPDLDL